MRAMENNLVIKVGLSDSTPLGVDTEEDLKKVSPRNELVMTKKIKVAFQGEKGAYSHLAILEVFPDAEVKACSTFEETFELAKKIQNTKLLYP